MADLTISEKTRRNKSWQSEFFLKYSIISAIGFTLLSIALILIATSIWDSFDWLTRTLSNLGRPENGLSSPFLNSAYMLASVGTFPFFVYVARESLKSTYNSVKLHGIMFILACVAIGGLSIFSDASETYIIHLGFSSAFFLFATLGMLLPIPRWLMRKGTRKYGILNLVIFLIALIPWIIEFAFFGAGLWSNQAIPEFISVIIYALLIITYSIRAWFDGIAQDSSGAEKN